MKHKVSEIEGELLDAAVAIAEGKPYRLYEVSFDNRFSKVRCMVARHRQPEICRRMADYEDMYEPSSPWNNGPRQALEIIERERIELRPMEAGGMFMGEPQLERHWLARHPTPCKLNESGPTMQIAAMRAYVAAKLGEEVEIADVSVPEKFPSWKRLEAGE